MLGVLIVNVILSEPLSFILFFPPKVTWLEVMWHFQSGNGNFQPTFDAIDAIKPAVHMLLHKSS